MTRAKSDASLTIRLPEELKRELTRIADKLDCNLSELVIMALRHYIHDMRSPRCTTR